MNPPEIIAEAMKATSIIIENRADLSWKSSVRMMAQKNYALIEEMLNFDFKTLTKPQVTLLRPILARSDFNFDNVKPKHLFSAHVCAWVINIMHCYDIYD